MSVSPSDIKFTWVKGTCFEYNEQRVCQILCRTKKSKIVCRRIVDDGNRDFSNVTYGAKDGGSCKGLCRGNEKKDGGKFHDESVVCWV